MNYFSTMRSSGRHQKDIHSTLIKSREEDITRRRYILRTLLKGSITLVMVAVLSSTAQVVAEGVDVYKGVPPASLLIVAAFFASLYWLSSKLPTLASLLFVGTYYVLGLFVLVAWGSSVPQGLLVCILVLTMSGVLLGRKGAFGSMLLIAVTLVALTVLETKHIIQPDYYWVTKASNIADTVVVIFTMLIIFFVSWLSNREIDKSLARARSSEADLAKERDLLEVKVAERTQALQEAQQKEISQLYHFAEFGKLSSGLLHDLVDPLTSVSMNLQQFSTNERAELLQRAMEGTKRMEDFVAAARKQIQHQRQIVRVSLLKCVEDTLRLLHSKAERAGVVLQVESDQEYMIYADVVRFSKLVTNLTSNAIDSFDQIKRGGQKLVTVSLHAEADRIVLKVTDNGCGIAPENMKLIFDSFYTTKSEARGMGLGLSICKEIVEEEFDGTLQVDSALGKGTVITANLLRGLNQKK